VRKEFYDEIQMCHFFGEPAIDECDLIAICVKK
jgi:hypothetical protein